MTLSAFIVLIQRKIKLTERQQNYQQGNSDFTEKVFFPDNQEGDKNDEKIERKRQTKAESKPEKADGGKQGCQKITSPDGLLFCKAPIDQLVVDVSPVGNKKGFAIQKPAKNGHRGI